MKLSIIIPCDNSIISIKQLYKVFNSIENQVATTDWIPETEVIILYANSNLRINISKYSNLSQVVKLYEQSDASIGMLKRIGLEKAQGEYILFLSPYQVFYHHAILPETIISLQSNNANVIYYYCMNESLILNNDFSTFNYKLNTEGTIYRTEFLKSQSIDFLDLSSYEDLYFSKRVLLNETNIQYANTPLVILLAHTDNYPVEVNLYNELLSLSGANISQIVQYQHIAGLEFNEVLTNAYTMLNSILLTASQETKTKFENLIVEYITFYMSTYKQLPTLNSVVKPDNAIETFEEFLNRILGGNKNE